MSDAARLELINEATEQIQRTTARFRNFNQQNIMLIIERTREEQEIKRLKSYHNIP